uniref:putative uncharacterized protein DDB_G0290521 n=1 Tax=Pristiophorus japonicus TaxID=55135 RepID=UPI00398ED2B5
MQISPSTMRTLLQILGYLIADFALTDPCVNHTVLDQSWRSTDCNGTECIGTLQCDGDLVQGWYRFKSSGGWKIPETVISDTHCSTWAPGWLNDPGTSPTQGPEEQSRETTDHPSTIPAGPTPSDPETSPTQGPEDQLTLQSTDHPSTIPTGSTTSDTETSPTQGPEEQSTRETTDHPSTTPQGSTTSAFYPRQPFIKTIVPAPGNYFQNY